MEAVQLTGAISGAVQQLAITSYRIHHVANVYGLTAPILDGTIEAPSFPRNPPARGARARGLSQV